MELIRIQKYLSECGVMSRRKAEEEIQKGKVFVNNQKAQIGQKIDPANDAVIYMGKLVEPSEKKYYIRLYKPRGYVSTLSDEKGRKCIADLIKDIPERVYPVGRLDLDSEGLLILTNDGELANKLMHPKAEVEKVYIVKVKTIPTDEQINALNQSMVIDGYKTRPAKVGFLQGFTENTLRFALKEGRNRQIRKMCEQVGLEISRLIRVSVGNIALGELKPGEWKKLDYKQVNYLLKL